MCWCTPKAAPAVWLSLRVYWAGALKTRSLRSLQRLADWAWLRVTVTYHQDCFNDRFNDDSSEGVGRILTSELLVT
jgi:hypothetical protein